MGRLFGTDGVRGIANLELTANLAYKLGQAGAYVLSSGMNHTPKILVGMDTRISGPMLECALIAGICSVGAKAVCLDVIPTPAVAYLTRLYKADAGVVISASHNSFEFNGIKFFDNQGYKLPDEVENEIERIILRDSDDLPKPMGKYIGQKHSSPSAASDYINFLKGTVDVDFEGMKVAVDCANGASFMIAPKVLQELGAEVYAINNTPDGVNINHSCGSTHLEGLQELMKSHSFDIGVAFDGDADRVLALDEKGEVIDGDGIMSIIGLDLKSKGQLADDTIVATVMSNMGLDIMAKKKSIRLVKTKVGDRYVIEEMLSKGYVLGGEQSGHIILLNHNTTGDGVLTALQLISILKKSGRSMSELASEMKLLPQVLQNARIKTEHKHKFLEDCTVAQMCKELETEFGDEGRVLIRPSGTEPLVRIMIEGKDHSYISRRAIELAKIIEERLG